MWLKRKHHTLVLSDFIFSFGEIHKRVELNEVTCDSVKNIYVSWIVQGTNVPQYFCPLFIRKNEEMHNLKWSYIVSENYLSDFFLIAFKNYSTLSSKWKLVRKSDRMVINQKHMENNMEKSDINVIMKCWCLNVLKRLVFQKQCFWTWEWSAPTPNSALPLLIFPPLCLNPFHYSVSY